VQVIEDLAGRIAVFYGNTKFQVEAVERGSGLHFHAAATVLAGSITPLYGIEAGKSRTARVRELARADKSGSASNLC